VVALDALWGGGGAELVDSQGEAARLNHLESVLLARLVKARPSAGPLKLNELAENIVLAHGRISVDELARSAGVSRQHLTRQFRERVGVTPKLFSRLARFHAGLAYAGVPVSEWGSDGGGNRPNWAQLALELGYADQSHMIAEFRQFSSLTPDQLTRQHWFHPFIERAQRAPHAIA
jgi:AraC-like DNA-binding protein